MKVILVQFFFISAPPSQCIVCTKIAVAAMTSQEKRNISIILTMIITNGQRLAIEKLYIY